MYEIVVFACLALNGRCGDIQYQKVLKDSYATLKDCENRVEQIKDDVRFKINLERKTGHTQIDHTFCATTLRMTGTQ